MDYEFLTVFDAAVNHFANCEKSQSKEYKFEKLFVCLKMPDKRYKTANNRLSGQAGINIETIKFV